MGVCVREGAGEGRGINCQSLKPFDPTGPLPKYHKAFDGECDGPEIRMYDGNGDNDGTEAERVKKCAEACHTYKTPLSGSWGVFAAI